MKTKVAADFNPTTYFNNANTVGEKPLFKRNRFTWLSYGLLGYYSYLVTLLGPVMAFLMVELNLSYTVSSLHVSMFSVGTIISGLVCDRVIRRFGRRVTLWCGASGMGLAAGLLVLSQAVVMSLAAAFLMGLFGVIFLATLQAALADQHGIHRGIALTEANVIASLGASLAAFLLGYFATTTFGWRTTIWLAIVALFALLLLTRANPVPATPPQLTFAGERENGKAASEMEKKQAVALPPVYWFLWGMVFLGVSIEWCINFWSIDFLEKVVGLTKSDAASVVGLYFGASVLGRWASSRFIRRFRATTLLPVAIGLVVIGFPLFWLGGVTWVNVGGLLLVGLGVANFYPLILSAALDNAPNQSNRASARLSLGTGLATLISPFALGWLSDILGLQVAFSFVLVLLGLILVLVIPTLIKSKTGPIEESD